MHHYDAASSGSAVDEFHAAYQAMPDARRDREGRELLLGSMRATLLTLHQQTGEAAPLCRLQKILQAHVDALTAAFPEDPDMLETRSIRARHDEVTAAARRDRPRRLRTAASSTAPRSSQRPHRQPPHRRARSCTTPDPGQHPAAPPQHRRRRDPRPRRRAARRDDLRDRHRGPATDPRRRDPRPSPDCPLTAGELTELQDLRSDARPAAASPSAPASPRAWRSPSAAPSSAWPTARPPKNAGPRPRGGHPRAPA
jgi:hypothetical protein